MTLRPAGDTLAIGPSLEFQEFFKNRILGIFDVKKESEWKPGRDYCLCCSLWVLLEPPHCITYQVRGGVIA